MDLKDYISTVNQKYRAGNATEHSYRGALEQLMQTLLPKLRIVNEPKRVKCGAPDYIASRKDGMPVFYIEAKDIGDNDLDGRNPHGHKEQFTRYKQALDYIIFTDYLDFHLYEHGEFVDSVRIAEVKGDKIVAVNENKEKFLNLIEHVGNNAIQRITSASRLAKLMAAKARLLENIIEQALNDDTYSDANDTLQAQFQSFRDFLIQELTKQDFADIYAQTIAYGMFAARLHDPTPEDFSREEAGRLIPKTNPFLRNLFNNVAGNELDERITWVVDDLVTVFQATNLQEIMKAYGEDKRHHDPMIHFYEDFLSEYNPKLRKSKGVWYTPQPVVGFIVRAVDEILQKEFNLPEGLADYSMIEKEVTVEQSYDGRTKDGMKHTMKRFHRVQILDPATGTGTFLAEVVNQIYDRYRDQQGIWQQYVEQHLIPRLHGFEILMASYAVAHIKLDMLLSETGYQHLSDKRLQVYLTNSLEESNNEPRTLFAQWLSREATEANTIKRDCPVMVMIGNPPYSGESQNKGEWIMKLMDDYKKEPGSETRVGNTKWLNDDYVKFIRLAQYYIEKNRTGLIGFINPHGFLDGLTFRGMRWNLLKTFDKIYTINLHGNSKRSESGEEGLKDENVFDIQQGVSINLFIKTGEKNANELGHVYYKDLFGSRIDKYNFLQDNSLQSVGYQELTPTAPNYFFVPKNFDLEDEYHSFFKIEDLFINNGVGICSKRDAIAFQEERERLVAILKDYKELSESEVKTKYQITSESADNKISKAQENVKEYGINEKYITEAYYRPFDKKFTYLSPSKGFLARPVYPIMNHLQRENVALGVCKQSATDLPWSLVLASSCPADMCYVSGRTREGSYFFPLYLYKENMGQEERIVNFNKEIYDKIAQGLNYLPCYDDNILVDPTSEYNGVLYPKDLFDYIYAVLHSPSYRERYKEFLKIDFPRIPYPTDWEKFRDLVELGEELRQLHLMEDLPSKTGITFPVAGSLQVDCYRWQANRVYINADQYFDGVPESAWSFFIGGYQPAQKWLKDRKGMTLSFEDVKHYGRIIYVLQQTERIMKEIDEII
ncbi:MAG: N-6 DNA methylase [Bacteroidaceae bacterium]|nr:N-6 DNA methylase [Bacteroidaceae bacterium]